MNKFTFWLMIINMVLGFINLIMHAYGSHSPASLAIGILNLFVVLYQMLYLRGSAKS